MSDSIDRGDTASADSLDEATADVVVRAHRRFRRCQKWEARARENWLNDQKFANGDEYNRYQWPSAIYETRGNRPTITVNETRIHNKMIINEALQHKASVEFRPVAEGATAESAEVMEGIYRHIQNISNGQMAQGTAIGFQVGPGLGFTLIESDYVDQDSFDQEIYIKAPPNPLQVYLDCDAVELDGSDARYGFIFADRPRDEIEEKYPDLKGRIPSTNSVDGEDAGWIREDHIREARYYEVTEDADELLADENGVTVYKSLVPPPLLKKWEAEAKQNGTKLKRRSIVRKSVKCHTIVGRFVVEETDIPGTSIPIIPWIGEQTIIDQQLDRKGHTRCMIGAQQSLNYNLSASVEYGALQSKTPWLAPVAAIADNISYWRTANTENHSVLPWKHIDDQGKEIPPPTRIEPPQASPVFSEGIQMARQFMMSASGQYEAELGAPGNEKSGKAINERQRQADRATYHFVDNQALAIRRQGNIIKEWIPVIYDTHRVLRIIGKDGEESHVQIDPSAEQAHQKAEGAVSAIFNPQMGKYEVVSDVGPDYATQRQEAFNAIVQILTQAPELIGKIGDLLFKVADFPMADEIAERLKPGMAPEAQQAITTLQAQLAKQNSHLGDMMQIIAEAKLKEKDYAAENSSRLYDAETKRLSALKDVLPMDPEALQLMVRETIRQALRDDLAPIMGHLQGVIDRDTPGQMQELPQ